MKTALASLLLLLALQPVSQATAKTKSITIGQFKYLGTGLTQTGAASSVYELNLDTTNVTANPITFSNVILIVKGTNSSTKQGGFPFITTGPGCGQPGITEPCGLRWTGGAGSTPTLSNCATYNATKNLFTQTCISIALQLISSTGKNFSVTLSDGSSFCTNGLANVFLLAKQDQVALDPQCAADGFCVGASVPVILYAAPAGSCNQ